MNEGDAMKEPNKEETQNRQSRKPPIQTQVIKKIEPPEIEIQVEENRFVAPNPEVIDAVLKETGEIKSFFKVRLVSNFCEGQVSDIVCEIAKGVKKDEIPEDLQVFYALVEETNSVIKALPLKGIKTKEKYILELLLIAQVGLMGEGSQPKLATKSITKLKEEIMIREAGKIKNHHFAQLGIKALIVGSVCVVLALIFLALSKDVTEPLGFFSGNKVYAYLFIFAGSMAGTWVSFGVRKKTITFNELAVIEADRLNSTTRLFFIGVVSVIFVLFINSSIITFSIGDISSAQIMEKIELQLLVGVIAGLLGTQLADRLFEKASKVVLADDEEEEDEQ